MLSQHGTGARELAVANSVFITKAPFRYFNYLKLKDRSVGGAFCPEASSGAIGDLWSLPFFWDKSE